MSVSRVYDLVMPLGMSCVSAMQLKKRGLRQASYPFDWVLFEDKESCQTLSSLVTTHFKDFLAYQNLELDQSSQLTGRYAVRDSVQKITFVHDFLSASLTEAIVDEVREKYQRRIDRFYQNIGAADSVCFVMAADSSILDVERLKCLYDALLSTFPNLQKMDLFAVVFESQTNLFEEYALGKGNLCVNYLTRAKHDYDIKEKVLGFAWLDDVGLSKKFRGKDEQGAIARKMTTWKRLHYKVYRHLYKWLERRGILRTLFDV